MRTSGAAKNYAFKQKNDWRNWCWNTIKRYRKKHSRKGVYLYLAGPNDADRDTAIRKGFANEDLIAVDLCQENIDYVRSRGGYGICADIMDLVWMWPEHTPIAGILADYCSGLVSSNTGSYDAFQNRVALGSIAVFNFMRGRDSITNDLRHTLKRLGVYDFIRIALPDEKNLSDKNRAVQFLMAHHVDTVLQGYRQLNYSLSAVEFSQALYKKLVVDEPQFYSYKSGHLVMDSVFCLPCGQLFEVSLRRSIDEHFAEMEKLRQKYIDAGELDPSVKRKIAATLAIRTQRAA